MLAINNFNSSSDIQLAIFKPHFEKLQVKTILVTQIPTVVHAVKFLNSHKILHFMCWLLGGLTRMFGIAQKTWISHKCVYLSYHIIIDRKVCMICLDRTISECMLYFAGMILILRCNIKRTSTIDKDIDIVTYQ